MNKYDQKYVEPLPWSLGGCNGRGITTPSGYIGDGLIADFDTKAHAEFALKRINGYDHVRNILDRLVMCDTATELGQIITGKAALDAAREYIALRKAERNQLSDGAEHGK
jgi:hypothetical protein